MTLEDEHWRALGLEADDLQELRRFLEQYVAALDDPGPGVAWLLDRHRGGTVDDEGLIPYAAGGGGGGPGGGTGWPPPDDPGGPGEPAGPRPQPLDWRRAGTAADALRGAACAALMTDDVESGARLLLEAAGLYREMGLPYGFFLGVAVAPDEALAEQANRLLTAALASADEPLSGELARFATALTVPAQQLYLLLAVVGHPGMQDAWKKALERTAHLRGPAPLGSSARPLVEWWELASRLTRPELARQSRSRRAVVRRLAAFAAAHGRQLAVAQLDRHHWRRMAVPVDLVDLDLACITGLLARSLSVPDAEPLTLDEFRVGPLAQISLAVGLQLGRRGPETTSSPFGAPLVGGPSAGASEPEMAVETMVAQMLRLAAR